MSNSFKSKFFTGAIAVVTMLSFAGTPVALGVTTAELEAQINSMLAALQILQTQLAAQTGGATSSALCNFTSSLTVGASGDSVKCLQQYLQTTGHFTFSGGATGFFGPVTKTAVAAWQAANGVSPAVGYFGPVSQAKYSSLAVTTNNNNNNNDVVFSGNGLKVAVASDSPNGTVLVQGQAAGELGKFNFINPTSAPIAVTNLGFKRIGVSNDSTMTNIYLYNGPVRITDSAGISNTAFNFNDSVGIFTVPANGVYSVSVRSDIAGSTSGQQIGVQLASAASSGTLDSSTVFPINGGIQTISAATLATVDFNATTLPSASTVDPQADYVVWQNTVTVGTRAVNLKSFQLRNIGSIQSGDVINFRLYVDGVQAGSQISNLDSDNKITFSLANPARLETGGRVIKVVADIVGGASRTFQMSLRHAADALMYDTDLNQPVLATANSSSFSARSATSATINSISGSAPSVTRAADSPTAAVANGGSNIKWASFKIIASGEDVKIENLNVTADTSSSGSGLDNGKVFVDGVQVGSTKDLAEYGGTTTNFTFGSSFIAKVGKTTTVDIYADAKTSSSGDLTAGETVRIYLGVGSSNGTGQVSLVAANVPSSEVTGNALTVSASTLTAAKASGYGNQTVIAGAQNMKIGSFTLSAASTEGVNVNTINLDFASAVSSTLSDMWVKRVDTGVQVGSSKATIGTDNSFTGSVDIPASGTMTFDIYANVKTGANAGALPALTVTTDTTGTGLLTGTSVSVGAAATMQTITIGSATLTVTQNTGATPDNLNVIAGASKVKVGSFRFTTQYSSFNVDQVAVKVTANAATAISAIILEYQNAGGSTQTVSKSLTLSSGAQSHATAAFNGLTFFIPADSNRDLTVYVDVPTVASAGSAISGKSITVILDANEGFNATDASGAADTSLAGSDVASNDASGKGTMIVRKSIPTLIAGTAPNATLQSGADQVIGRFNVVADAAGDIDWGQVLMTLSKTAAITTGATTTVALWDITSGGATSVPGTFATTTGALLGGLDACQNQTTCTLHFRPTTVQTVSAGQTRNYELRATIGGTASGANNVSVTIPSNKTSVTTSIFSTVAGTIGTSSNGSFVWSDWSDATDHASSATGASTADWTDDYLVKSIPLTIGSRSLNF